MTGMRESINIIWKVAQKSEADRAATWMYRMVLLALVTALALNQSTAPSQEVLEIVEVIAYAGLVFAGWHLLVPVAVEAYKVKRGIDG